MSGVEPFKPHCTNEENHPPHAVFCRNVVRACAGLPVVAQFDVDLLLYCGQHSQPELPT